MRGLPTMHKSKDPSEPRKSANPVPHKIPKLQAAEKIKADVLAVSDEVFDRYVLGEPFEQIAQTLDFFIQGWKLREVLMVVRPDRYPTIGIDRAHHLVESSIEYARKAAAIGDAAGLRVAIDTNLKVAAKLNAADYGEKTKVELTGKDGKALEIKADLSLTAEQAYERLIKGK